MGEPAFIHPSRISTPRSCSLAETVPNAPVGISPHLDIITIQVNDLRDHVGLSLGESQSESEGEGEGEGEGEELVRG